MIPYGFKHPPISGHSTPEKSAAMVFFEWAALVVIYGGFVAILIRAFTGHSSLF